MTGSPPLARGILGLLRGIRLVSRITPACAGNTQLLRGCFYIRRDHPRLRGEYAALVNTVCRKIGSPPLARGIRFTCLLKFIRHRITPACAGNTISGLSSGTVIQDHPRLRGEYLFVTYAGSAVQGSPPLARGIL